MPSISRRQFLTGTGALVATATLGDAFVVEPTAIEVTRHDLPIPGLPPELDGFRIACVTDLHLHGWVHRAARATLALLAREQPHLVTLIGDMCNRQTDLDDLTAWSRRARGTVATVATLGNWEHDAEIDRAMADAAYGRAGVELLYNTHTRVRVGSATLAVVGIDDPVMGHPDAVAAEDGLDPREACIWVVHAPGYIDQLPHPPHPPAAVLSGHTHGGQIRLPGFTPYTPFGSGRFVAGWYRDTLAPLYVSRGIGTVGIRARLFCPPELPIFTLRPVAAARRGTSDVSQQV
jgi:uncharacterized protein